MPDKNRQEVTQSRSLPSLTLLVALAALLAGFLGYWIGHQRMLRETTPPPPGPTEITDTRPQVDPAELITIHSEADIERVRERLTEFFFGRKELPDDLPTVAPSFLDKGDERRFEPFVASVETLLVEMDEGLVSRALHFMPRDSNGTVVIVHEGHERRFLQQEQVIRKLLEEGYAVMALFMPLFPPNSQPEITIPPGGMIRLQRHDQIGFIEPEMGHPIKYFIEPVIRVINHIEARTPYSRISMLGISGGGWTTVIVAAMDPRVVVSVPVAGSYPIYLRAVKPQDWGDWEQTLPELYRLSGYLDLYVLGSAGCGRRQVQVFNQYDTCCYGGTASKEYESTVDEAVRHAGNGSFKVIIDSHFRGHAISPFALNTILETLAEEADPDCP